MRNAIAAIRKYAPDFTAKIGIILGSGLSSIAEQLTNTVTIPYQAIPGLHSGSVAGHASLLILGYLNDVPVACLKGRLHLYEGASYESVRTLVRIVKMLGASTLLITAAAGSLRPEVGAGEIMMIKDHINFQPGNPLAGPNDESFGPRFISMEKAYDPDLCDIISSISKKLAIPLHEGVYLSLLGPSYETPAEIRAFATLGADAVGMSVVPEVIIARHCGLHVACLTAITNLAAGLSKEEITHEGTLHYGAIAARKLARLIPEVVREIKNVG